MNTESKGHKGKDKQSTMDEQTLVSICKNVLAILQAKGQIPKGVDMGFLQRAILLSIMVTEEKLLNPAFEDIPGFTRS